MPEVDTTPDIEACFNQAMRLSAGEVDTPRGQGQRGVVIITPRRLMMAMPCPDPATVTDAMRDAIRKLVPAEPKQSVVVIGQNDVIPNQFFNPQQLSKLIPFIGYLLGIAGDGHRVVVFEGHPTALEIGCRHASLLIIDGGVLPLLQKDWLPIAKRVMQPPQRVLLLGRDGSAGVVEQVKKSAQP